MYLSSDKPRSSIDFYKEVADGDDRNMLIESEQPPHNHHHNQHQHQHQHQQQLMIMAENNNNTSSGEDHELRAPKKRAETWIQEETRILIGLRREVDRFFNTSKSNKHMWEQILSKMRDKGFDYDYDSWSLNNHFLLLSGIEDGSIPFGPMEDGDCEPFCKLAILIVIMKMDAYSEA